MHLVVWHIAVIPGLRTGPIMGMIEALASRPWPVAIQHGDLAPWNLLRGPDGTLAAIDWECAESEGFPYLDLAHYVLQIAGLVHRWPAQKGLMATVQCLEHKPWPGLDAREAEAITCLAAYLAYRQSNDEGFPKDAPYQLWRRGIWDGKG